jgi:hypothetical protein
MKELRIDKNKKKKRHPEKFMLHHTSCYNSLKIKPKGVHAYTSHTQIEFSLKSVWRKILPTYYVVIQMSIHNLL